MCNDYEWILNPGKYISAGLSISLTKSMSTKISQYELDCECEWGYECECEYTLNVSTSLYVNAIFEVDKFRKSAFLMVLFCPIVFDIKIVLFLNRHHYSICKSFSKHISVFTWFKKIFKKSKATLL